MSADPRSMGLYRRLSFLVRDSSTYGVAAVLNRLLSLITFPLLSRHFSVADYGLIDFLVVLVQLMTTLFVMGQDAAVARFYYEATDDGERRQVISQSLAQQLGIIVLAVPLLLAMADTAAATLLDSPSDANLLRLAIAQVPFFVLVNFSQNILKWTFGRTKFVIISVGSAAATAVALLLAVVFDGSMTAVFAAYLGVRAVFGVLGLWFVREWIVAPQDWRWLRRMFPYAVPFGLTLLIKGMQPAIERSFVVGMLPNQALGLYAAGAKVGLLIGLPVFAFQTAWGPFAISIFKEKDASTTFNVVLKVFCIGIYIAVLALAAFGQPLITILASDRYVAAASIVFASAFTLAMQGVGVITGVGISFSKRSYLHLWSYAGSLLVMFGVTWFAVRIAGFVGVAYGAMLGSLVKTALDTALAERAHRIGWHLGGVALLTAITLVSGIASHFVAATFGWPAGALAALSGVGGLLAAGWTFAISPVERAALLRRLSRLSDRRRSSDVVSSKMP